MKTDDLSNAAGNYKICFLNGDVKYIYEVFICSKSSESIVTFMDSKTFRTVLVVGAGALKCVEEIPRG